MESAAHAGMGTSTMASGGSGTWPQPPITNNTMIANLVMEIPLDRIRSFRSAQHATCHRLQLLRPGAPSITRSRTEPLSGTSPRLPWVVRDPRMRPRCLARSAHAKVLSRGTEAAVVDRRSSAALELAVVIGDIMVVTPLPASGSVTIGRGATCNVRIDNPSVSRRHAILHLGPALRIDDLGSENGTVVCDHLSPVDATTGTHPLRKLAKESSEIAIGERIILGTVWIVVRRAAPATAAGAAADPVLVHDPKMQELYQDVARAARSTISVLILGETGVGKEVVAHAVHDRSRRARAPFLELNCAALAPSLLEAELFGHEKGAFTGADQARPGLLESADGGTVFLDEVGELPLTVQVKLLRILEDRKVLRIGGRNARKLDVRFIAATNRDLET